MHSQIVVGVECRHNMTKTLAKMGNIAGMSEQARARTIIIHFHIHSAQSSEDLKPSLYHINNS